jgi:hypothetical protein
VGALAWAGGGALGLLSLSRDTAPRQPERIADLLRAAAADAAHPQSAVAAEIRRLLEGVRAGEVNAMSIERGSSVLGAACVGLALTLTGVGCLGPKLEASKLRSERQEGMPYYLPRPYLLVTKNFNLVETTTKTTRTTKPDGTQIEVVEEAVASPDEGRRQTAAGKTVYAYQVIYLPDQCQLYGLRVARGIGTLDSRIELEDGWKFTGTSLETDSKTPETIEALGKPVSELGKALAGALASGARLGPTTLLRESDAALAAEAPEGADVALYDLFTGECQFAWPNRDACPEPPPCPLRE